MIPLSTGVSYRMKVKLIDNDWKQNNTDFVLVEIITYVQTWLTDWQINMSCFDPWHFSQILLTIIFPDCILPIPTNNGEGREESSCQTQGTQPIDSMIAVATKEPRLKSNWSLTPPKKVWYLVLQVWVGLELGEAVGRRQWEARGRGEENARERRHR